MKECLKSKKLELGEALGRIKFNFLILQVKKVGPSQGKGTAQGHGASTWPAQANTYSSEWTLNGRGANWQTPVCFWMT